MSKQSASSADTQSLFQKRSARNHRLLTYILHILIHLSLSTYVLTKQCMSLSSNCKMSRSFTITVLLNGEYSTRGTLFSLLNSFRGGSIWTTRDRIAQWSHYGTRKCYYVTKVKLTRASLECYYHLCKYVVF